MNIATARRVKFLECRHLKGEPSNGHNISDHHSCESLIVHRFQTGREPVGILIYLTSDLETSLIADIRLIYLYHKQPGRVDPNVTTIQRQQRSMSKVARSLLHVSGIFTFWPVRLMKCLPRSFGRVNNIPASRSRRI